MGFFKKLGKVAKTVGRGVAAYYTGGLSEAVLAKKKPKTPQYGPPSSLSNANTPWYKKLWNSAKGIAGDVWGGITGGGAQNADGEGQGFWGNLGSSARSLWENYGDTATQLAGAKYGYDKQLEGIREQNASAKQIADQANAMSQANAREQMAFQERMSSTAHQREASDLQSAGLNRILSGTGGMGAATGGGASGSVTTAPVHNEGEAMSSAMQLFKSAMEAINTQAQTAYTREVQTPATQAQTVQTKATTGLTKAQEGLVNATKTKTNAETANKLQDTLLKAEQTGQVTIQNELSKTQIDKFKQEIKNAKLTEQILNSDIASAAAKAAQATIEGEISESQLGIILTWIDRVIESATPIKIRE